jgi:hypothetical protein
LERYRPALKTSREFVMAETETVDVQGVEQTEEESHIVRPNRALHRKYLEPIFFLADKMCTADGEVAPSEHRMIEELALSVDMKAFRSTQTFRHMKVDDACKALDIDTAKNGAMVIMTLLLKADTERRDSEHKFFTTVRERLGSLEVVVPVNFEAHRRLALKYLAG